jgi:ATP-dependent Clp protease ATP-binding subunit ClpB
MLLAGDVLDGSAVKVSAGAEGLVIGDRVSASRRTPPPAQAVIH